MHIRVIQLPRKDAPAFVLQICPTTSLFSPHTVLFQTLSRVDIHVNLTRLHVRFEELALSGQSHSHAPCVAGAVVGVLGLRKAAGSQKMSDVGSIAIDVAGAGKRAGSSSPEIAHTFCKHGVSLFPHGPGRAGQVGVGQGSAVKPRTVLVRGLVQFLPHPPPGVYIQTAADGAASVLARGHRRTFLPTNVSSLTRNEATGEVGRLNFPLHRSSHHFPLHRSSRQRSRRPPAR